MSERLRFANYSEDLGNLQCLCSWLGRTYTYSSSQQQEPTRLRHIFTHLGKLCRALLSAFLWQCLFSSFRQSGEQHVLSFSAIILDAAIARAASISIKATVQLMHFYIDYMTFYLQNNLQLK